MEPRRGPEATPGAPPRREARVVDKAGVEDPGIVRLDLERHRSAGSRALAGHPIAPTEFPKGWSATGTFGLREPPRAATCTPQEEDAFHWSRPETATGLGLPPNVLQIVIANGQPSTDSIGAGRREPTGLQGPLGPG